VKGHRQIGRAGAALELALHAPGTPFGGLSTHGDTWTTEPVLDPAESAIDEAATEALWASKRTPEWVRALGEMREACRQAWRARTGTVRGREAAARVSGAHSTLRSYPTRRPDFDSPPNRYCFLLTYFLLRANGRRAAIDGPPCSSQEFLGYRPADARATSSLSVRAPLRREGARRRRCARPPRCSGG
jgi:hypothetical protein